jgi:hypothetical protein
MRRIAPGAADKMKLRRAIGPALAFVLLTGVGVGVRRTIHETEQTDAAARHAASLITIRVLTGSEKVRFLTDPDLAKILDSDGMALSVQKADSRDIPSRTDLASFDVIYAAGEPVAAKIMQSPGAKGAYTSLYTPLAVASWKSLIPVLQNSGAVSPTGSIFTIDMAKLVAMMEKDTRWKDLPGNTAYPASKSVLITSSDVQKSNSAGMYLALAAYLANGDNVVERASDADKVASHLAGLFARQGFQETSATGPFEDYTVMGIGKAPLVMIYEQQFLDYVLSHQNPNPDMVLLYPRPTILSKQTLVAMSDQGARFAQIMTSNPQVISIAHRYGFRTQDNSELFAAVEAKGFAIPHTLVDVIDPPSYDILEKLIHRVDVELNK